MKRLYMVMALAVVIAAGYHIALENLGYHRIAVEGGTLFGKAAGKNKDLAVLLLAGSGPTDMDGNTPLASSRNDSLLLLARELAREGVSTFRYDKRSAGKSAKTFNNNSQIEFEDFVRDCIRVIEHLKKQGYNKVVVAGHSKGSLTGMLAAREAPADGFISLAGTGFPIDITLEKQLLGIYSEDSPEIRVLRNLREGKRDSEVSANHPLFSPDKQEFFLTWMAYDPAVVINGLNMPILIIHGEADLQVDYDDFTALKNGAPQATYLVLPGMNHVLKKVADSEENIAAYSDPSFPLHEQLVPAVLDYIRTL